MKSPYDIGYKLLNAIYDEVLKIKSNFDMFSKHILSLEFLENGNRRQILEKQQAHSISILCFLPNPFVLNSYLKWFSNYILNKLKLFFSAAVSVSSI